jgi:hypothetical protein
LRVIIARQVILTACNSIPMGNRGELKGMSLSLQDLVRSMELDEDNVLWWLRQAMDSNN